MLNDARIAICGSLLVIILVYSSASLFKLTICSLLNAQFRSKQPNNTSGTLFQCTLTLSGVRYLHACFPLFARLNLQSSFHHLCLMDSLPPVNESL